MSTNVSPFTFVTWKDDENALVAGTEDTDLGYFQLLSIDGINVDDIIAHAVEAHGQEGLTKNIATNLPFFVAALAAQKGTQCFVQTKKATVEFADLNTGEVDEREFPADEANFNESVRVDTARAEYTGGTKAKKESKTADQGAKDDDDDDYEDVDSGEEDEDEDEDEDNEKGGPEQQAYMAKRRLLEMVGTQMETAMTIAFDLGLTVEDISAAYKAAVPGPHPVPQTAEECLTAAEHNMPLMEHLRRLNAMRDGDGEEEDHHEGGMPGMPAGMPEGMPAGMPAGMPSNCPQQ